MPGFPFPGRPGRELDEPLLDMLLTGGRSLRMPRTSCMRRRECPPACPDPAGPGELAGEAAARSAYARAAAPVGVSPVARRSTRRRPAWLSIPLNARLAAALVAAAVGPGGAAAHAEAPPGPIQDLAHRTIGASAARHLPSGRQAGCRLCDGYERAKTHGPSQGRWRSGHDQRPLRGGLASQPGTGQPPIGQCESRRQGENPRQGKPEIPVRQSAITTRAAELALVRSL